MSLQNKFQAARIALSSTAGLQRLKLEKNAPHILFGVGMVGFGATVFLASKATLSVERVLDDHEERAAKVKVDARDAGQPESASEMLRVYVRTGAKLGRLYGPAALAAAVSVTCLTKSHMVLTQRNAALTAAYIAVDQAFKQYRRNVVEKFDEATDADLMTPRKVEPVLDEKGRQAGEKIVNDTDSRVSMYGKYFGPDNKNWNFSDPSLNIFFLRQQQNWLNDKLKVQGHLFLNEVYDHLGLPRTTAGSVVGWLKKDANGDENFVDFGIFDGSDQEQVDAIARLVLHEDDGIWLDFNVDGPIYRDI